MREGKRVFWKLVWEIRPLMWAGIFFASDLGLRVHSRRGGEEEQQKVEIWWMVGFANSLVSSEEGGFF